MELVVQPPIGVGGAPGGVVQALEAVDAFASANSQRTQEKKWIRDRLNSNRKRQAAERGQQLSSPDDGGGDGIQARGVRLPLYGMIACRYCVQVCVFVP